MLRLLPMLMKHLLVRCDAVANLASAPAATDQENVIEQLKDGRNQPGNIGECGSIQHLIDAAHLFVSLDDAGLAKQLFRAGGGVKFHGQGGEGKDCAACEE